MSRNISINELQTILFIINRTGIYVDAISNEISVSIHEIYPLKYI